MSNLISSISVDSYVKQHNRQLEKTRNISNWFLDETLTIDFGDYVGRPSALITMQKEYIVRFLENGWTISNVSRTKEVGVWQTSAKTTTANDGTSSETMSQSVTESRKTSGSTKNSEQGSNSSTTRTSSSSSTSGSTSSSTNTKSSSSSSDSSSSSSSSRNSGSTDTSSSRSNTSGSSSGNTKTSSGSSSSSSTSTRDGSSSTTYNNGTASGNSGSSYNSSSKKDSGSSSSDSDTSDKSSSSSTGSSTTTHGGSSSNSSSSSSSHGNSSNSSSSSTSTRSGSSTSTNSNTSTSGSSSSTSSGSSSEAMSDSTTTSRSTSGATHNGGLSEEEASGAAYWATVQTITLKRRRMQPELVLQDMIGSYITEHNVGVSNEDARYNELVTLYGIMLNRNETEGNAIINDALDVTGLFEMMRKSIQKDCTSAGNYVAKFGSESTDGAVVEIRLKFEALISNTRSGMVCNGTYNDILWPTVENGIKRQMEAAIAEVRRGAYKDVIDMQVSVLGKKGVVMAQLVNAKNAIAAAIDNRKVTAIGLRNTVMQAMLNFMGSREDSYPMIQEISNLASQIGFTVGAAGNVL